MITMIIAIAATILLVSAESATLLPAIENKNIFKIAFAIVKMGAMGYLLAGWLIH